MTDELLRNTACVTRGFMSPPVPPPGAPYVESHDWAGGEPGRAADTQHGGVVRFEPITCLNHGARKACGFK